MRPPGGEWVQFDTQRDSRMLAVDSRETQLIFRILADSPATSLAHENDAQQNTLITENAFPLARSHKTFSPIKLQLPELPAARTGDLTCSFH